MIDNTIETTLAAGKEKQVIRAAMETAGGFTLEALKKVITPLTLTGGGVIAALQAAAVNYSPFASIADILNYNYLLSDAGKAARIYKLYNISEGDTAGLIAAIQAGVTITENAAPKTRNLATVANVGGAAAVTAAAWLSGVIAAAANIAQADTATNELPRTSFGGADLETVTGVLGVKAAGLTDAELKGHIHNYFAKYLPATAAEQAQNYNYSGYGGYTSGGGSNYGNDAIL